MKKIAEPDAVAPVVVDGTRYEAPRFGKAMGFAQNGGHVSAVDVATGRVLWTVTLYEIAYARNLEADKQDVFVTEMSAAPDGRALLLTDGRGRRWRVDLASRAASREP